MLAIDVFLGNDAKISHKCLFISLASLGSITFFYYALSLLSLLYRILIPGINIKQFHEGDRPAYAIVTGPTSGIGKSFAHALAKNGFNLILVSRSLSKLQSLQSEIKAKFPDVDIIVVDVDLGIYPLGEKFAKTIKDVSGTKGDIRVLVNNAGMSHDIPVTFEDMTTEEMEAIVGVNTGGVLRVTKETLPYLLSDSKKKRLIVNVGSFAGYAPPPLLATYSGTKAFLSAWSLATKHELADKNVIVQYLNAYLVTTKLAKIRRSSLLIPTEDAFVRGALHNIGRDGAPYWSHAYSLSGSLLMNRVFEWVLGYLSVLVGGREGSVVAKINKRMHEDIRRRALRKAAKSN